MMYLLTRLSTPTDRNLDPAKRRHFNADAFGCQEPARLFDPLPICSKSGFDTAMLGCDNVLLQFDDQIGLCILQGISVR